MRRLSLSRAVSRGALSALGVLVPRTGSQAADDRSEPIARPKLRVEVDDDCKFACMWEGNLIVLPRRASSRRKAFLRALGEEK